MERLIKILEGTGTLTAASGDQGETDYDISVLANDAELSASGMIEADPFLLLSAFDAGGATLRLQEGTMLDLSLKRVHAATSSAEVVVKGKVPK